MEIEQLIWDNDNDWHFLPQEESSSKQGETDLLLVFGERQVILETSAILKLKEKYPNALITGCGTSGQIYSNKISENGLLATAIKFNKSKVKIFSSSIQKLEDSEKIGEKITNSIPKENLKHILILADSFKINGSLLLKGIANYLPNGVNVTGGLSGEGLNLQQSSLILNNEIGKKDIILICLYGDDLLIDYSYYGGWDPFGLERIITKSENNIIFEIDNQPALDLLKNYLGDLASNLPESALLLPFLVYPNSGEQIHGIVRSVIAVNEKDKSLLFPADILEGSKMKLMKGNLENLITGAGSAANNCITSTANPKPELAFLVSCVGRKQLLQQRTEEEIEIVRNIFGVNSVFTGFYSYGEICPINKSATPSLHNQTMTITTISER